MTRFVEAASDQLQTLKQQMQQLGQKGAKAPVVERAAGLLGGLNYGALLSQVTPLIGPMVDSFLERVRAAPVVKPVPAATIRPPRRVFTVKRVLAATGLVVFGGLAYGLGSGRLRVDVPARRLRVRG